ncbi:MAG: prepilin-type N-terminal cleavage/methylation domain-containing protein [Phycisphaeraceae bacterium]|nr:prepilin-type N-terminal cleavage/methylation domain-containing protein [Phycisphaeraceae bacterium]
MMSIRTRTSQASPRAFTLVEVLLGIIILAIGLLGLASVFPLVVKQQRQAQDVVVGVSSAEAAESFMRSRRGYFSPSANDIVGLNAPSGKSGWGALSWALYQTALQNKQEKHGLVNWSDAFKAGATYKTAIYGSQAEAAAGNVKGAIYIGSDQGTQYDTVIKPYDRLLPAPSASVNPLFIWDIAPMLATPIDPNNQIAVRTPLPLRITVFIRRIDPGIRVPAGLTLGEAIAQGKVLPLGVDSDGMPTLNGNGEYPHFFYPTVQTAYRRFGSTAGPFNVVQFQEAANSTALAAARQVGQQLVDVEGNVYTVVALPDETGTDIPYANVLDRSVVIEPGIPAGYLQSATSTSKQSGMRSNLTVELLCSPHIPAKVSTFLIRP